MAREFLSRLTRKYLTYFLSRDLSHYVEAYDRFTNIEGHAEFNSALDLHWGQAWRIVDEISGGWLSKGDFAGPITQRKAGGYVHVYGLRHRARACARTRLLRRARR